MNLDIGKSVVRICYSFGGNWYLNDSFLGGEGWLFPLESILFFTIRAIMAHISSLSLK